MRLRVAACLALACAAASANTSTGEPVWQTTLMKRVPRAMWHLPSALVGDFNCDGKPDRIVLGLGPGNEVLLAAFFNGDDKPPTLLRWKETLRERPLLRLQLDSPRIALKPAPEGYRASAQCATFSLSDDEVDALHFYWNHKRKKLSSWSE